jgi:hypothetical protein
MHMLLGCLLLLPELTLPAQAQVTVTKFDSGRTMVRIERAGTFLPEIGATMGDQTMIIRTKDC